MRSTRGHLAIAGAGLLAALTLSACGTGDDSPEGSMGGMGHGSASTTTGPTSGPTTGDPRSRDVAFAQMMIPHHQQAVEMADVALENPSASADVRALARQVKAAQDPEIETMRGWLRQWGASASDPMRPTDHGGGGMMSAAQMQELEAAQGREFDRLWLTMMVEHHEGAVTMAQDVLGTTADPQVKAMAQAIVEAQQKEIATMQGMLG